MLVLDGWLRSTTELSLLVAIAYWSFPPPALPEPTIVLLELSEAVGDAIVSYAQFSIRSGLSSTTVENSGIVSCAQSG